MLYQQTPQEEQSDESAFWLELTIESGLIKKELIEPLLKETNEITAIMVATAKTASKNNLKS